MGLLGSTSKHTLIYALCEITGKGIAFFLIPLYTSYLSTAQYGILEILTLTTWILSNLVTMGFNQSLLRFFFEHDEKEKRDRVIAVSLTVVFIIGAVVIPLGFVFSGILSKVLLNSNGYDLFFEIVLITMALSLIMEVPVTILRAKQKSISYGIVMLSRMILQLSLNVLFIVKFEMGILGILVAGLIAVFVPGIIVTISLMRSITYSFSLALFKKMLMYSMPLAGSWFGMFILHFGDRFILQKLGNLSAVGIYALAYKFGMLANVLVTASFQMTWLPKQFEIAEEEGASKLFARIFTYYIFVLVFVSLGICIPIKPAIELMATPEYHSAYLYVAPLSLSYVFYGFYIYLQFGFLYTKKTVYLGIATIATGAVNVGLNFLLIPRLNIWGPAITTMVSFFVASVSIYAVSQRHFRIPYEFKRLAVLMLVAGALFAGSTYLEIRPVWLSLIVKLLIAISYPVILYVLGFLDAKEKDDLLGFAKRTLKRLRGNQPATEE